MRLGLPGPRLLLCFLVFEGCAQGVSVDQDPLKVSEEQERSVKSGHTILPSSKIHKLFFNPAIRDWRTAPAEDGPTLEEHPAELETRIVGGELAVLGNHAYSVAIMLSEFGIWCGGVIYSTNVILTAAHCFFERRRHAIPKEDFVFVVGKNDLRVREPSEELSTAAHVLLHEDYSVETGYNDIAIVMLVEHLCFDEYVQPLPISPMDKAHSGTAEVSGWGYTWIRDHNDHSEAAGYKKSLEVTRVEMLEKGACQDHYANDSGSRGLANHPSMLCAGHSPGGQDACNGDSGGPLVCRDELGRYLCGIVSTGVGCGLPNRPAFYTDIAHFHNWIRLNAGAPARNCH